MATKTIYLTIDFFFHHWHNPSKKKLWLGVLAYAENKDVTNWIINSLSQGNDTDYKLVFVDDNLVGENLTPIPLPTGIDFTVSFQNDVNDEIEALSSKRQTVAVIKNEQLFKELNGFVSAKPTLASNSNGQSYAEFFNTSLLAMAASKDTRTNDAALQQWLAQKLEMGQRIKFTDKALFVTKPYFDAAFEGNVEDNKGISATNQLFLLGQLLPFSEQISDLSTIKSMQVQVGSQVISIKPKGQTAIENFFKTLNDFKPTPGPTAMHWHSELANRVNVIPRGENFSTKSMRVLREENKPLPIFWSMRQSRSDSSSFKNNSPITVNRNSSNPPIETVWHQLERTSMRLSAPLMKTRQEQDIADNTGLDFSSYPTKVTLEPVAYYNVKLSLYRKAPSVIEVETKKVLPTSTLLQIRPTAEDEERFFKLINTYRDLLEFETKVKDKTANSKRISLFLNPFGDDEKNEDKTKVTPSEINLDWLQCFAFPWDNPDPTVDPVKELLAGVSIENAFKRGYANDDDVMSHLVGNAVLMIKLTPQNPLKIELTGIDRTQPGWVDPKSVFGPRWEQWRDSLPSEDLPPFNGFFCPALSKLQADPDKEIDLDNLVISTYQKYQKDFEWAQSARRLEGVITARFKGIDDGDDTDPTSLTAYQAYLEDKVNHNRLNVFEHRISGETNYIQHRNADSCLQPVFYFDNKNFAPRAYDIDYVFHIKLTDRTSAVGKSEQLLRDQITSQIKHSSNDVRLFYKTVYDRIGAGRTVEVNLEHTYGSCMPNKVIKNIPNPLDEPIVLACDIEHISEKNSSAVNTTSENSTVPFMHVDYAPITPTGKSQLTLTLNRQLLDKKWVGVSDKRWQTHILSWQSVAEAVHAEKCTVVVELYDFTIQQALQSNEPSIISGLKVTSVDIPIDTIKLIGSPDKTLKQTLISLLQNGFDTDDTTALTFIIKSDSDLGKHFHALRCRFNVKRKSNKSPKYTSALEMHGKLERVPDNDVENLFSKDGCVTQPLNDAELKKQLEEHITRLQHRAGYLTPTIHIEGEKDEKEQNRFTHLAAMLGTGQTPEFAQPSANAWLVLPNKVKKEGVLDVAYCPIGIKPIVISPQLGEFTSQYLRRYFSGLQSLIDFSCHNWFAESSTNLKKMVESMVMDSSGDPDSFDLIYRSLIDAALDKLWALPDPNVESTVLDSTVRQMATTINTSLAKPFSSDAMLSFKPYLRRKLLQDPSLFDKLKSLAVIQVKGKRKDGQLLPEDFHNLVVSRIIEAEALPILDSYDLSQALRVDDNTLWYLEMLDDDTYDNEFNFTHIIGERVERAIEQQPVGKGESDYSLELLNNQIRIPEPTPKKIVEAGIQLSSRKPVINPKFSATHQSEKGILGVDLRKPLVLKDFVNARSVEKGDGIFKYADPVFIAKSKGQNFDNSKDLAMISAVFNIEGDEESDTKLNRTNLTDPLLSIVNDTFYILLEDDDISSDKQGNPDLSIDFEKAVQIMRGKKPLSSQSLENLISPEVVKTCRTIISAEPSQKSVPKDNIVRACRVHKNKNTNEISLIDHGSVTQSKNAGIWLFKGKDTQTLYLWVQVAVPIWKAKRISLVQTRNERGIHDPQKSVFSSVFATISDPVSGSTEILPIGFNRSNTFTPIRLPRNNTMYTPEEFTKAVLAHELNNIGKEFQGKYNNLTISIKEDASSSFPSGGGGEVFINNGSFEPHLVYVKAITDKEFDDPWSNGKVDFFPNPKISRWRVDFEWRTIEENKAVLRIEDIPVELE
jgi:hypothetical protein